MKKFNATCMQRASLIAAMGCKRIWEICNFDNQKSPSGTLTYTRV